MIRSETNRFFGGTFVFNLMRRSPITVLRLLTLCAFAGAWVSLFSSVQASAQANSEEEYMRIIDEAVHEYDLERWSTAIELFQKANAIKPNARTLRGMGLAAYEDQRFVDAIRWLSESLEHPVQPLNALMRDEIKPVLEHLKGLVGYYKLDRAPATLDIEIDGRSANVQQGKLQLDPGEHRLVATAKGFEPQERELSVKAGDNGILGITLDPIAPSFTPPAETRVAARRSDNSQRLSDTGGTRSEVVPWVLIGTGASLAVAGGILFGIALNDKYQTEETTNGWTSKNDDAVKNVPIYSAAGIGLAAAGVVSATIGIVLLASSGSDGEKSADTSAKRGFHLRAGLASLSISGGF